MFHLTVPPPPSPSLRQVQDCATAMRRWLATDDNSAALMAHLRAEQVDPVWLSTFRRLLTDLTRSIDDARRTGADAEPAGSGTPC
ncbi:MAG: hypothetical protein EOP30_04505 [Rhodococcus sp. (in: high G+C Gram-positive bacteria)]|nr:MAG: hypothetical protein EOP30_04505 [Rhodococcus sp. (in: high G+C Gram-positive bacteria)]